MKPFEHEPVCQWKEGSAGIIKGIYTEKKKQEETPFPRVLHLHLALLTHYRH